MSEGEKRAKRNVPKDLPPVPTHPLSEDHIVVRIGVFLGLIPFATLTALALRATFTETPVTMFMFVPFTAVLPFVVQMAGLLITARNGDRVSKNAGRMMITTILFIVFAIIMILGGIPQ